MTNEESVMKMANRGYSSGAISRILDIPRLEIESLLFDLTKDPKYAAADSTIEKKRFDNLRGRLEGFTEGTSHKITVEQVVNKFGVRSFCYLTGRVIDLRLGHTYELDHIVPRSRGGDSNLDNLGLLAPVANRLKGNLTPRELVRLCHKVVKQVTKKLHPKGTRKSPAG